MLESWSGVMSEAKGTEPTQHSPARPYPQASPPRHSGAELRVGSRAV